jgi:hypothetical protein
MDIYKFADGIRERKIRFTCPNCGEHKLLVSMNRSVMVEDTGERVAFTDQPTPYFSAHTIVIGVCATPIPEHRERLPNTGCGWSGDLKAMTQEFPANYVFPKVRS